MTNHKVDCRMLAVLVVASALAPAASAQYTITTIAGGGPPDGVSSTGFGLGYVYSVAIDNAGNIYAASSQHHRIYKAAPNGTVTTVAGNGTIGFSGDYGPAASAQLNTPMGIALDAAGNLYIADAGNVRIRKVSGGTITTVVGSGAYGYSGDGGPALSASMSSPSAVAVDSIGNLYIADSGNQRIRKVAGGTISTVAGNGSAGYFGDGGPAQIAQLNYPYSLVVDTSGNLFIADGGNYRIRKVTSGIITTVAGVGVYGFSGDGGPAVNAQIGFATGVAVDSSGNLYIADGGNQRIRKVAGGMISTFAGGGIGCAEQVNSIGDGCAPISAILGQPSGVGLDSTGNLYISDTFNYRIRKISGGVISTVMGNGSYQYSGDNGLAINAQLNPQAIAVRSRGIYYAADPSNYRVRGVSGGLITTAAGSGFCCTSADNIPATVANMSPTAVAADASGNFYIGDGNRVRKVSGGLITAFAGNGSSGFSGDNGPAVNARLSYVRGVAVDGAGTVYIADPATNRVRKVSGGVITTFAGGGPADGVAATTVSLGLPVAVAVDGSGNVYTPSPADNRVYKIAVNGTITALAGNGSPGLSGDGGAATAAQLNYPYGVAVNSAGTVVYIADRGNNRVRMVTGGVITTVVGGGSGCLAQSNPVGDGCAGTSAVLNAPAILRVDSSGNLYIADALNYRVRKWSGGIVTTVAGNGTCCYSGDNGPATAAQLNYATGIAIDGSTGDLYIGDSENFRVRKVAGGIITTIAGNGSFGFSGDGGPATNASLSYSYGISIDGSGNLYIADAANARIRKVSGGVITTVAGTGFPGYSGDGSIAANAQLNIPYDVVTDAAGNLYIADTNNYRIRKISSGNISTIAGNGSTSFSGDGGPATSAQLSGPSGMAIDGAGNVYIADTGNLRIRKVSAGGTITTVAGNGTCCYSGDGIPAVSASISYSVGIAADSAGTLYLADSGNSRIRRVSGGVINTIAGIGAAGFYGDGGLATNSLLNNPQAVALDNSGNIYIADSGNARIRLLTASPKTITSISPASAIVGSAGFTLQVNGSGFAAGDTIQWNGTDLTTTFVNGGQLTAPVAAGLISTLATAAVTVNGLSNSIAFTVLPAPTVTITSSVAGASITVSGTGCSPGTYVTPVNLAWTPSTFCTVMFASPQFLGGSNYTFSSSRVNGTSNSTANPLVVNSGTGFLTINATFVAAPAVGVVSVVPNSGTGAVQVFSGTYVASAGHANLRWVQMLFAIASDGGGQPYCFVHYDVQGNSFWLYGAGGFFVGPVTPGTASNHLQNSLCALNTLGSSVSTSGSGLTINASLVFKTAAVRNIYMRATNMQGTDTGWVQQGAWTMSPATMGAATVNPAAGSSVHDVQQTFTLSYPDPAGFAGAAFGWVQFLAAAASDGGGQPFCFVHYDRAGNGLWMYSGDVGFFVGPVAPGAASSALNSSACSVNTAAATASNLGGNLVVSVPITMKGPMTGAKKLFQRNLDVLNRDSGWLQTGTWTIQ